jgi:hypothetical protein
LGRGIRRPGEFLLEHYNKSDAIKHLPENPWLQDDGGQIQLKDGEVISVEDRADKGFIIKLGNPYFPGHALIVCAGLGRLGHLGIGLVLLNSMAGPVSAIWPKSFPDSGGSDTRQ